MATDQNPQAGQTSSPAMVRVRIAVAVDHMGQWAAHGLWRHDDAENKKNVFVDDLEPGEAYYWIEATLPVPMTAAIEGEVSHAE